MGKTEQQCKAEGFAAHRAVPFSINGRASTGQTTGFVKIIATPRPIALSDAHHPRPRVGPIQRGTTMEFKGAAEDIARIVHGHPTLSEVVREAALALDKRSLNS